MGKSLQNKLKKKWSKTIFDETEMLQLGAQLARHTKDGLIVFLYGDLGAGKTTLARGFLQGLGMMDKVKSPTYTLVEPYQINQKMIFHFDFYRLRDPRELEYLGLDDYFFPTSICLVEWPEKGMPFLPESDLACYIEMKGRTREVTLIAHSERGSELLNNLA